MLGLAPDDIVVNVQGDEPLLPPAVIDAVADLLEPAGDGAFGDGLTELWQRDIGHGVVSLFDRIRRSGCGR